MAMDLIAECDKNLENSPLPEKVPVEELDEWLFGLRMSNMLG
jgi:hypothetical protein